jgi:hypothetical protein
LALTLHGDLDRLSSTMANQSANPGRLVPAGSSYLPVQGMALMQSGLWSIDAIESIGGRTLRGSGTRCITPEMVAQISTGNGQLLFNNNQGGGNCQLQQNLQGRQIIAGGQCINGNMSLQMPEEITFDTPQHFQGHMALGMGQGMSVEATVDGHLVGGC